MNLEKYIAKALENIKECINCINFYFPEIFAKIEETREKFSGFEAQEIETCTKNELNDKVTFVNSLFETVELPEKYNNIIITNITSTITNRKYSNVGISFVNTLQYAYTPYRLQE